ncbi:MAG: 16S rRNA (adenine(1518)-N(6)/adenine(1519)-N(6))-dimethyltransferase RsmA [Clostridia bacterium]
MDTLNKTKGILKLNDIKAKKAFGQNFLIDDNILSEIITCSNIKEDELIIEIGPGLGNLTDYILSETKNLITIELDDKMIDILNSRFTGLYVINKDILKCNIDDVIDEYETKNNIKFNSYKVIANLPYYITSPIIFKLIQDSKKVSDIIVMVQEEVANRMIAIPRTKDYSVLTVMLNFYSNVTKVITVPNTAFIPSPNVISSVVYISKDNKYANYNEKLFIDLVHKSFLLRRKKLVNSLFMNNFLNLSKERIEKILIDNNIDLNSRAEELSIDKYLNILDYICKSDILI